MTQPAALPVETDIVEEPQCMHYWVIQPATGPVSAGICQTCGEAKEFKNYVEGASWGDSRLSNRSNTEETKDVTRVVSEATDDEETEDE